MSIKVGAVCFWKEDLTGSIWSKLCCGIICHMLWEYWCTYVLGVTFSFLSDRTLGAAFSAPAVLIIRIVTMLQQSQNCQYGAHHLHSSLSGRVSLNSNAPSHTNVWQAAALHKIFRLFCTFINFQYRRQPYNRGKRPINTLLDY